MSKRLNWREQPSPLIPIYFIDIVHLREVIENGGISDFGLELLLDYYEEFEMYEKAAVIQNYLDGTEETEIDVEIFNEVLENPPVPNKEKPKQKQKGEDFDPFNSKNPFE